MGVGRIYRGGSGGGEVSGDYIPTNQKGTPGGVSTLDGNGKVYKNQLNHLTASDVGALASFTETDPSVSQLIKEIVTVNDLLSKVNLASGNLSDSLFPFSINDYITISQKGVVNGVASLNINGLIPKNQINLTASDVNALPSSFTETDPSVPPLLKTISTAQDLLDVLNSAVGTLSTSLIPTSVDEILRYANVAVFPASGDVKKIYLEQENNRIYRWSGSSYIEISSAGIADTATKLATARTITFTGGDVAGSYNFDGSTNISTALTLATVNSTTGVFGNATQVPVITTNGKGLITNIETTTFTPAWGNITGIPLSISALVNNDGSSLNNINQASNALKLTNSRTISLTGDGNWSTSFDGSTNVTSTFILTTVNINTGTFGSATQIPTFTVNEKGLVTGVTNTTIAPNWNSITNLPTSISILLNNDGSLLNNIDASKITTGVISASVLPSYVDDFLTFADLASFPATGQTGKIYLAENTNISYRWTGVSYVDISSAGISDAAVKLNTPRTISITGDGTYSVSFDGSVNVTAALILATVNANVGAFGSATQVPTITVNAKGLVTGVTHTTITPDWSSIQGKPNNLAGYGITDAQPLGNELTALQNLADTAGFLKKTSNATYSIDTNSYLPLTGGTLTGAFLAASGTSLLPGISFDGDTDTGIYRSADNVFNFITGGVTRVAISTTKFDIASSLKLEVDCTLEAASQSVSTGAFTCAGGGVFMKSLWSNAFTCATDLLINGTTAATSTTTGSLKIPNGGASIGGDLYVGGRVYENNTQTFLISTSINLAANTYINMGNIIIPVNGKEKIYLISLYLQFDAASYNQAQGSTIISCIPWKSDYGTQSIQSFKVEAHAISDFNCSILLGRSYETRSISLSFDIPVSTVAPGFLRLKFKELT